MHNLIVLCILLPQDLQKRKRKSSEGDSTEKKKSKLLIDHLAKENLDLRGKVKELQVEKKKKIMIFLDINILHFRKNWKKLKRQFHQ